MTGQYQHTIDTKGRLFIPAKCEPDAQGRIVLPQKLRAYAHLEKDVVVIGVSNRAEIWNAEKWAEIEAEELNPENLAAVMEELGF